MKTLMIIEDDEILLGLLTRLLSQHFHVIDESCATKAIKRVREEGPDIVLADVALPGCTGIEIASAIRTGRPGGCRIPVALMSGEPLSEAEKETAGADFFIEKPFDLGDLICFLKKAAGDTSADEKKFCRSI